MSGPTRAEVLATPPRDADAEVRALLQAAEDCQPEWQPRPTRTTTLPSIDDYQEPEMTDDLSKRIAAALREHGMVHLGDQVPADEYDCCGEVALAAIRGAYVPPPPGSDRAKLPDHLLAVAAPHMPPYTSTACQMADALEAAASEHPRMAGELREAAERQRSSCRITRKQDMAKCQHPQHQEQGR